MKTILKMREGIDCGSVRNPLPELVAEDMPKVKLMIDYAYAKFF